MTADMDWGRVVRFVALRALLLLAGGFLVLFLASHRAEAATGGLASGDLTGAAQATASGSSQSDGGLPAGAGGAVKGVVDPVANGAGQLASGASTAKQPADQATKASGAGAAQPAGAAQQSTATGSSSGSRTSAGSGSHTSAASVPQALTAPVTSTLSKGTSTLSKSTSKSTSPPLGRVIEPVAGGLGSVLGPVTTTVAPLTGPVLDTVAPLTRALGPLSGPVGDQVGQVLVPVTTSAGAGSLLPPLSGPGPPGASGPGSPIVTGLLGLLGRTGDLLTGAGTGLPGDRGWGSGGRMPSTPFPAQFPGTPAAEGGAGSLSVGARGMGSGGAAATLGGLLLLVVWCASRRRLLVFSPSSFTGSLLERPG